MDSDLPAFTQAGDEGSVEPAGELAPAVFVLDLLVFFQVIAQDETGPLPVPLDAPHLLAGALRDKAALVPILEADDDVGFGVRDKLVDLEVPDDFLVIPKFHRDVAQVLDCQLLRRGGDNDVVLYPEEGGSEAEVMRQRGRLGVTSRGRYACVDPGGAVEVPALPVEVGRSHRLVVHGGQIHSRKGLDEAGSECDRGGHGA